MNLDDIFTQCGSDKGFHHHYGPLYERHVGQPPASLLEFGVATGEDTLNMGLMLHEFFAAEVQRGYLVSLHVYKDILFAEFLP